MAGDALVSVIERCEPRSTRKISTYARTVCQRCEDLGEPTRWFNYREGELRKLLRAAAPAAFHLLEEEESYDTEINHM